MIKCEKCGTENEDGSKFCKSCGSVLHIEPVQTVNPINYNSTISTVKKVAMWIGIAVVAFIAVVILINFIQDKRKDSKIRELRNGCVNNDAKICYELGIIHFYSSGLFNSEEVLYDEKSTALAKGCQLGNKDACREGGYHKQGCELQDGKSCYELAYYGVENIHLLECKISPDSGNCLKILKERSEYEKKYFDLACQYGYSKGCMK